MADGTKHQMQIDENDVDDGSFEFSASTYGSLVGSDVYGGTQSYIHSNSKSYSVAVDEKGSLIPPRKNRKRMTSSSKHYISFTGSSANATHSISHMTTSNFFGFNSAAYAAAQFKEEEMSKTLSLADILSSDRHSPSALTFFQILSMLTGLSVFVLPSLVARCGLYIVPMIIGIGLMSLYTSYLINKCQYQVSKTGVRKRVYRNYIDIGKAAIRWNGEGFMKVLVATNIFTDIYCLIFCAQISIDLITPYFKLEGRVWMIIWMLITFPLFFIRKMSVLAWFGFFSLAMYVIGLCFATVLLITHYGQWSLVNIQPENFDLSRIFIGYGIIMNTYNYHLAVPAVEASMKTPTDFNRVNAGSYFVNIIIKIFVAIAGAITFGVLTKSSILTNLTTFGIFATIVNIMIALHMYTQFPTSMFVVFEMMDLYILPKFYLFKAGEKSEWAWLILTRVLVSVFIVFIAVSLPNFEMLTSFIGNIRGTFTEITLPIYFYVVLNKRKLSKCSMVFHIMTLIISTSLSLVGAGFSIRGMIIE